MTKLVKLLAIGGSSTAVVGGTAAGVAVAVTHKKNDKAADNKQEAPKNVETTPKTPVTTGTTKLDVKAVVAKIIADAKAHEVEEQRVASLPESQKYIKDFEKSVEKEDQSVANRFKEAHTTGANPADVLEAERDAAQARYDELKAASSFEVKSADEVAKMTDEQFSAYLNGVFHKEQLEELHSSVKFTVSNGKVTYVDSHGTVCEFANAQDAINGITMNKDNTVKAWWALTKEALEIYGVVQEIKHFTPSSDAKIQKMTEAEFNDYIARVMYSEQFDAIFSQSIFSINNDVIKFVSNAGGETFYKTAQEAIADVITHHGTRTTPSYWTRTAHALEVRDEVNTRTRKIREEIRVASLPESSKDAKAALDAIAKAQANEIAELTSASKEAHTTGANPADVLAKEISDAQARYDELKLAASFEVKSADEVAKMTDEQFSAYLNGVFHKEQLEELHSSVKFTVSNGKVTYVDSHGTVCEFANAQDAIAGVTLNKDNSVKPWWALTKDALDIYGLAQEVKNFTPASDATVAAMTESEFNDYIAKLTYSEQQDAIFSPSVFSIKDGVIKYITNNGDEIFFKNADEAISAVMTHAGSRVTPSWWTRTAHALSVKDSANEAAYISASLAYKEENRQIPFDVAGFNAAHPQFNPVTPLDPSAIYGTATPKVENQQAHDLMLSLTRTHAGNFVTTFREIFLSKYSLADLQNISSVDHETHPFSSIHRLEIQKFIRDTMLKMFPNAADAINAIPAAVLFHGEYGVDNFGTVFGLAGYLLNDANSSKATFAEFTDGNFDRIGKAGSGSINAFDSENVWIDNNDHSKGATLDVPAQLRARHATISTFLAALDKSISAPREQGDRAWQWWMDEASRNISFNVANKDQIAAIDWAKSVVVGQKIETDHEGVSFEITSASVNPTNTSEVIVNVLGTAGRYSVPTIYQVKVDGFKQISSHTFAAVWPRLRAIVGSTAINQDNFLNFAKQVTDLISKEYPELKSTFDNLLKNLGDKYMPTDNRRFWIGSPSKSGQGFLNLIQRENTITSFGELKSIGHVRSSWGNNISDYFDAASAYKIASSVFDKLDAASKA